MADSHQPARACRRKVDGRDTSRGESHTHIPPESHPVNYGVPIKCRTYHGDQWRAAFSLVELLVVMAVIAVLAALLLPALSRAREKARVARVHVELYGIGLALHMYSDDFAGRVPPVRENCNTDYSEHWCQLPPELAEARYLARSTQPGREAALEDLFDPGHTYKYAAPGRLILNGEPAGNYALWIPTNFPELTGEHGRFYDQPATSPVRWAVWSLGTKPASAKSRSSRAPMSASTWYRHTGDSGVIVRYATRDGIQFKSP